jgi:hypothetical protein
MSANWFVLSEGQQLGPYTGEQLVQYAQEGRVATETMVWAEGMAEWVMASQVPGLFPEAPVAVAAPAAAKPALATSNWAPPGARATSPLATAPATAAMSPYATPHSSLAPAPAGGSYPFLPIKPASFSLWMWTFIGGFISLGLVVAFFALGISSASSSPSAPGSPPNTDGVAPMLIAVCFYGLAIICLILSTIFFYMNVYRAWSCLRAGAPRTTPGQAIGMMFIPFYNLYWIFVAIAGLPKDWNRIVSSYDDLQKAPRLSETTFLMFCIGSLVFPPLSMIVMFPMMSQLCAGINFFAYRRNATSPSGQGPSGFGGIKFG